MPMTSFFYRTLTVSLLVLLSGCGNYFSVKIPYSIPGDPGAVQNRGLLNPVYILARVNARGEGSALADAASALAKSSGPDPDAGAFARKLAASFRRPGSSVAAYRVGKDGETDGFVERLNPASVLEAELAAPFVAIKKEKRETSYTDKDKKRRQTISTAWVYSISVEVRGKLSAHPSWEQRDSYSDNFVYSQERTDDEKTAGEFYEENEDKLFSLICASISGRYLGRPVLRYRPVFFKKENKELKKAADYARNGHWPQAKELWEKNMAGPDGWRAALGLAVASERENDYAAARGFYGRARDNGAGDKDAGRVAWSGIFSDLDYMIAVSSSAAPPVSEWFSPPTALLPFSEETGSVNGPVMVREMLAEAIKDAGYNFQELSETDRILKSHGYSDGGQLGAARREDLFKWLGVERIIYGDITDFGEVMAGLYNRRVVSGSFYMLEQGSQAKVWTASETVSKVKTPKSFMGGMVSQLAKGLWERIKNKPLAEESARFVKRVASTLPNKAK